MPDPFDEAAGVQTLDPFEQAAGVSLEDKHAQAVYDAPLGKAPSSIPKDPFDEAAGVGGDVWKNATKQAQQNVAQATPFQAPQAPALPTSQSYFDQHMADIGQAATGSPELYDFAQKAGHPEWIKNPQIAAQWALQTATPDVRQRLLSNLNQGYNQQVANTPQSIQQDQARANVAGGAGAPTVGVGQGLLNDVQRGWTGLLTAPAAGEAYGADVLGSAMDKAPAAGREGVLQDPNVNQGVLHQFASNLRAGSQELRGRFPQSTEAQQNPGGGTAALENVTEAGTAMATQMALTGGFTGPAAASALTKAAPAMAFFGLNAGQIADSTKQSVYGDLIKQGVDPVTAQRKAETAGGISAALQTALMATMGPQGMALGTAERSVAATAIARWAQNTATASVAGAGADLANRLVENLASGKPIDHDMQNYLTNVVIPNVVLSAAASVHQGMSEKPPEVNTQDKTAVQDVAQTSAQKAPALQNAPAMLKPGETVNPQTGEIIPPTQSPQVAQPPQAGAPVEVTKQTLPQTPQAGQDLATAPEIKNGDAVTVQTFDGPVKGTVVDNRGGVSVVKTEDGKTVTYSNTKIEPAGKPTEPSDEFVAPTKPSPPEQAQLDQRNAQIRDERAAKGPEDNPWAAEQARDEAQRQEFEKAGPVKGDFAEPDQALKEAGIEKGEEAQDDGKHALTAPTEEEYQRMQQPQKDMVDRQVDHDKENGLIKTLGGEDDGKVSLALSSLRGGIEHNFPDGPTGKNLTMEQVESTTPEQKAAEQIAARLGRKLVLYKTNSPNTGGANTSHAPDVLLVNSEGTRPILAVTGHELTHSLSKLDPEVYSKLLDTIQANDPQAIELGMKAYMEGAEGGYGSGGSEKVQQRLKDNPDYWKEEGVANVMMEAFQEKGFWERMSQRDPDFFQTVAKTVVQFVRRMQEAWSGVTGLVKKPEVLTNIADVLSDYSDKINPPEEVAKPIDQAKVIQAGADKPTSADTAGRFLRAMDNKLTPEDETHMGISDGKAGVQSYRLGLLADIKAGNPDAKADLAASLMPLLRSNAEKLTGRSDPESLQDSIQAGIRSLMQTLGGERRAKEDRDSGPTINDYDPDKGDLASWLNNGLFSAQRKAQFPAESGTKPSILQTAGPITMEAPGGETVDRPIAAKGLTPPEQAIVSEEGAHHLDPDEKVAGDIPPKLQKAVAARGGTVEGFDGNRAIIKLTPTGEPSTVSVSRDAPNLYRSGDQQLEVFKQGDDYYTRPFGDEGAFQRSKNPAEFDEAAKTGKLLPSAEDIAKLFGKAGEATPEVNFSIQKAGPGEDPDEVRIMLGKAAAESAPNKTIGSPELANPGNTPANRSAMNAIDELRTQAGEPEKIANAQSAAEGAKLDPNAVKAKMQAGEMLNTPETFAAKAVSNDALSKLVKGGADSDIIDAAKTLVGYRAGGSEQARAMQARADTTLSPGERALEFIKTAITRPVQPKIGPATPATPEQIVSNTKEIVEALKPLGLKLEDATPEKLNADTATRDKVIDAVADIVRAKDKAEGKGPSYMDMAKEYWKNAILSAPLTLMSKVTSDAAQNLWHFGPQRFAEIAINTITRGEGAKAGEIPHILAGVMPGVQQGVRNMVRAWSYEGRAYDDELPGDEMTGRGEPAIAGQTGRNVRIPTRALRMADAFFTSLDAHMQVGAESYRLAKNEGLSGQELADRMYALHVDPTSEAWSSAMDTARSLTGKDNGVLAKAATSLRDALPWGTGDFLLPFTKTPANLVQTGIRKSPLGSIPLAVGVAKDLINFRPGGDNWTYTRSDKGNQALAEQALAWGGLLAVHGMVSGGMMTGSGTSTSDEKEGERNFRAANGPPESIKLGDTWYSYKRIEPFATALSLMVNASQRFSEYEAGSSPPSIIKNTLTDTKNALRDKTFFKGIGDLIRAGENPEQGIPQFASNFAASWVPNVIRQGLRSGEEDVPSSKIEGANAVQWTQSLLKHTANEALPGLYDPPPKVDWLGRPQAKTSPTGNPATDWLYRMTVPVQQQQNKDQGYLDRVVMNWNNNNPTQQFFPLPPPHRVGQGASTYEIPAKEYEKFSEESGKLANQVLSQYDFNYDKPTPQDMKIIKTVLERAHSKVALQLFGPGKMTEAMHEEHVRENPEFIP